MKRLLTFCQRAFPTDPSRSVDFDAFRDAGRGAAGEGSDKKVPFSDLLKGVLPAHSFAVSSLGPPSVHCGSHACCTPRPPGACSARARHPSWDRQLGGIM